MNYLFGLVWFVDWVLRSDDEFVSIVVCRAIGLEEGLFKGVL